MQNQNGNPKGYIVHLFLCNGWSQMCFLSITTIMLHDKQLIKLQRHRINIYLCLWEYGPDQWVCRSGPAQLNSACLAHAHAINQQVTWKPDSLAWLSSVPRDLLVSIRLTWACSLDRRSSRSTRELLRSRLRYDTPSLLSHSIGQRKSQCQPKPKSEGIISTFLWEDLQSEITKRGGDREGKIWGHKKYSCCTKGSHGLFLLELLVLSSFWPMFQKDMRQTLWMLLLLCLTETSLQASLTKRRDGVIFFIGTQRRKLLGVRINGSYIISYGHHKTSE